MRDRFHTNFPRVRHDEHGLEYMWTYDSYACAYRREDMYVYRPYPALARWIDQLVGVKPSRNTGIEYQHKQLIDAAAHGLGHGDVYDWYPNHTYVDVYLSALISEHMKDDRPFVVIAICNQIDEDWALGPIADALKKLDPERRRSIYIRLSDGDELFPSDDLIESNDFYTDVVLGRGHVYGTCHYDWRYNDKLAEYR